MPPVGGLAMGGARDAPPSVLIACSGLGHVGRGFETFALELHAALLGRPDVRTVLARARGPAGGPGERLAPTVNRETRAARLLGAALRRDGYVAEQLLYALALLPVVARERPRVVLVSDWALAIALGRLRLTGRMPYRLLLSNGAPGPPPYPAGVDHVQHLTPRTLAWALDGGEPAERHTMLPLGVAVPPSPARPAGGERAALRARLGLPADRPVVLSVAALNLWSKRLDHLVRAVAELEPRPFLALVGQPEAETPAVLSLARDVLGPGGFAVRTVSPAEVPAFYRAADVFALASLHESMARVLVEALSHGLPTVAHDSEVTRFVMGGLGMRGDLTRPGTLSALIDRGLRHPPSPQEAAAQHAAVRARFGWDALAPRWAELVARVAEGP
jgi:1,2-diacylglycerol 3-alpha-glucosyltransferase